MPDAGPFKTPAGTAVEENAGAGLSATDGVEPADVRRNMLSLVSLEILFTVGAADLAIALDPLLVYLGASNTLIGLVKSAVFVSLLGLVVTPYLSRRFPRKRPLVFLTHIPYIGAWGLLGLSVLLSERLGLQGGLLYIVAGLWVLQHFLGGFVSLPIQEYIAACIPTRYRGRFTGLSLGIGGIASIGSAAIATLIIARLSKPESFGWCFVYCWFFAQGSMLLMFFAREQPAPVEKQPAPWSAAMFVAAHKDTAFVKYLVFTFLNCALFGPVWSFLPVYGMKELGMPATSSGLLQIVIMATRMVVGAAGGVLVDRLGPRRVLPVLPLIAAVSVLPVLLVRQPWAVYASTFVSAIYIVVSFTGAAALIYGIPRVEHRTGHYSIYFIAVNVSTAMGTAAVGRAADVLTYHGTFLLFFALFVLFVPASYFLVGPRARGETI